MDLPTDFSARLKFSDVTKWFEKIYNAKTNNEKAALFQKFIDKIRGLQAKFYDENGSNANGSAFPILRLFLPKLDTERDSYGLQMITLGRLLVKALAINPKSADAQKLTLQGTNGDVLDYGTVVYNVMAERSPAQSSLTVHEVNTYLDLIAEHFKQNERSKIDTEMVQMLQKLSAIDRKWLARIILKKIKLGLGERRMLQLYHKNANNFYNQYSHLSNVIKAIETGQSIDQHQTTLIELFKPIRPMLCERGYIKQINRMLEKHEYYLETKMDGERFHIHIDGRKLKYFSRSCNEDFTQIFGADSSGGIYSPMLYRLLNGKIQNGILDGEMMVWDRENEVFHTKSEHSTARYLKSDDQRLNPCFVIYDLIYLNDVCLANKPYAERQRLFRSTFVEQKGLFMFCAQTKVRDGNHFLECLNKAFDANEEGVVIKQSDSFYRPGQRDKGGWFKIKPDYTNNLITDFDLLIIGANYNEWRTSFVSFLLGVFKKDGNECDSGQFYAVCSVRNGFSRAQFREICQQLAPHWNKVDRAKNSRRLIYGASRIEWNRAQPDVWIEPKHSIVLQVKGSELTETNSFRTSHTIRFARVIAIRKDKPWYDTCTLDEFQKFCSSNSKVEKLTKRQVTTSDMNESVIAPLPKRQKKDPVPLFTYCQPNLENIEEVDQVCKGLDFCILSCDKKSNSINQLKSMVLRHGGRAVENPGSKTFVCIAGDKTQRVLNVIKSEKYNVASTKWLLKALSSEEPIKKLLPFTPKTMLFKTQELIQQFSNDYDFYGDSYTEPIDTEEELIQFLNEMQTDELPVLTTIELHTIEVELSNDGQSKNIFRLCTAYFYKTDSLAIDNDIELAEFLFRTEAGTCLRTENEVKASASRLTHIFVRDTNFDQNELRRTVNAFGTEVLSDIVILRCQWILDCYRDNRKICNRDYIIYLKDC